MEQWLSTRHLVLRMKLPQRFFSKLDASSEFKDYKWAQLFQVLKGILAL